MEAQQVRLAQCTSGGSANPTAEGLFLCPGQGHLGLGSRLWSSCLPPWLKVLSGVGAPTRDSCLESQEGPSGNPMVLLHPLLRSEVPAQG